MVGHVGRHGHRIHDQRHALLATSHQGGIQIDLEIRIVVDHSQHIEEVFGDEIVAQELDDEAEEVGLEPVTLVPVAIRVPASPEYCRHEHIRQCNAKNEWDLNDVSGVTEVSVRGVDDHHDRDPYGDIDEKEYFCPRSVRIL